jgi:hypothetical protein
MLRFHSGFPALALSTALAMPVHAGDAVFKSGRANATLLELYSSEGCSSCPPAEAWVSELKNSPGLFTEIFPVVFHVDYWDGLGWRDKFAKAVYTRRQRNYAAALSHLRRQRLIATNRPGWRRSSLQSHDTENI